MCGDGLLDASTKEKLEEKKRGHLKGAWEREKRISAGIREELENMVVQGASGRRSAEGRWSARV